MQKIRKQKCDLLKKHNKIFGEYPEAAVYKNLFLNDRDNLAEIDKYINEKIKNAIENLYQHHYTRSATEAEVKIATHTINCNGSIEMFSNKLLENKKRQQVSKNFKLPKNPNVMIPAKKSHSAMIDLSKNENITNSDFSKTIDRIFVINDTKNIHKFNQIKNYLDNFGFETVRFVLSNNTDPEIYNEYTQQIKAGSRIGNSTIFTYLLAYIQIIKQARQDNLKNIIILDEDVMFHKNFNSEINKAAKLSNAGVIYLGCYQKEYTIEKMNTSLGYYKAAQSYGLFAVLIRNTVYDILIQELEKKKYNPDQIFVNLQVNHIYYVLWENLVVVDLNSKSHVNTGRIISINKKNVDAINKIFGWNMNNYNLEITSEKKSGIPDNRAEKINTKIQDLINSALSTNTEKISSDSMPPISTLENANNIVDSNKNDDDKKIDITPENDYSNIVLSQEEITNIMRHLETNDIVKENMSDTKNLVVEVEKSEISKPEENNNTTEIIIENNTPDKIEQSNNITESVTENVMEETGTVENNNVNNTINEFDKKDPSRGNESVNESVIETDPQSLEPITDKELVTENIISQDNIVEPVEEKQLLKPGLSFLVYMTDDNTNLETCISSISDIADEIVLVSNGNNTLQTKVTELMNLHKNLRYYNYIIDVDQIMAINNSTAELVKYQNWCLSKTTRYNVIEWRSDYIAIKENLTKMIRKYYLRLRSDKYLLWFLGKKLYIRDKNKFIDIKSSLSERCFSRLHDFVWQEIDGKLSESSLYIKDVKKQIINEEMVFLKAKTVDADD